MPRTWHLLPDPEDTSPGAPGALQDSQLDAISLMQRSGSTPNPHCHHHVLALDGLGSTDFDHGIASTSPCRQCPR